MIVDRLLGRLLDQLRGKAVTIPPMDGALRPNTRLDDGRIALEVRAPDNLVHDGARVLYSSGADLFALPATRVATFEAPITALAAAPDGGLAIGLDDGRIILRGAGGDRTLTPDSFESAACPTALAFADPATLLVCQGSARCRASDWVVDLMQKNSAGSLWRVDLAGGQIRRETTERLASGLAFPYGLLVEAGGRVIVAESWRHRLLAVPPGGGRPEPVLAKLPGYPARLCPAADGGAWLALFAPRNRLIEFTLIEDDYRTDMMREIPRDHWIAPALASGASFLEPLQCGGVRTMGIHKPWSPTRSYGLVLRLDPRMQPVASLHSRANGARHGVTSLVEAGSELLVAAKGGNAILTVAGQGVAGQAGEAGHA